MTNTYISQGQYRPTHNHPSLDNSELYVFFIIKISTVTDKRVIGVSLTQGIGCFPVETGGI